MRINTRQKKDVAVVELIGDMQIGAGDVDFRRTIQQLLAQGSRNILIDMAGLRSMDSSGLGELVRSRATAATAGATIKLLHVEDEVHRILKMTQLIGVFETFDDEIDAIQSFG
jgi:anti-sigma B factor antagonist